MVIAHPINLFKWISILVVLVLTCIAGIIPLAQARKKADTDFPGTESFAAGIFLGAGLIHLLSGSAMGFAHQHIGYPAAALIAGLTFLVLLLVEHIHQEIYSHHTHANPVAVMALIMLSLHAFLAGSALGLSTHAADGLVVLIAILSHKWAASLSLGVQLTKTSYTHNKRMTLFLLFALMTPLGILFGTHAMRFQSHHTMLLPILNAIAAGTFLYIGTLHGLSKSILVKPCCNLRQFLWVFLGFGLMAAVALYT